MESGGKNGNLSSTGKDTVSLIRELNVLHPCSGEIKRLIICCIPIVFLVSFSDFEFDLNI